MTGYIAIVFLIGILLARTKNGLFFLLLILLLGYLFLLEYGAGRYRRGLLQIGLLAVIFLSGMLRYSEAERFRNRYLSLINGETPVRAEGLIYQKERKNQNTIYYITNSHICVNHEVLPTYQIRIYLDSDDFQVGDFLTVNGTIEPLRPATNEGNFDAKAYYESRKLDLLIFGETAELKKSGMLPVRRALFALRERLASVYLHALPEKDAGILCTMLLGDKSSLDTDMKELYQSSGFSHILAISGLHISLIGMLMLQLLRRLRLPEVLAAVLSGIWTVFYTIMTGASPSSIRACLMFLLALAAPLCKRSYDSLTALAVAGLALLIENPFLVGYSGFLFSFSAVIAVVCFARVLTKGWREPVDVEESGRVRAFIRRRRGIFLDSFGVCFAIQLVTVPLVMTTYYEVPIYTLLINLVLLPLSTVLLSLGLLGGVIGLVGMLILSGSSFPVALFPAKIILFIPHLILRFYEKTLELVARLPGASLVTGKPASWLLVLYYVGLVGAFLFAAAREKKAVTLLPVALLLALMLVPKQGGFELSVLDVGQGDGIFLSTKAGVAMVDGGSTDVKEVGKYRLEPFLKSKDASHVDFWLVTHTDADHISGLKELLQDGYRIDTLVFSKYVWRDEALEELLTLAEENGTKVAYMDAGQEIRFGEGTLKCVFPDAGYAGADKNAMSLVTVYTEGDFSALLTGDISAEEEAYLLKNKDFTDLLSDLDFYKAAHHGSKYSNSEALCQALTPEAAAISCGAKNRYGHPSEEALSNLKDAGTKIYDTRFDGQIKVTLPKGRMKVAGFRNRKMD